MKLKTTLSLIFLQCACLIAHAQPQKYSVANAHSHNDYEQKVPFWLAYDAGFGSIEADIFLVDTVLYVAHDRIELQWKIKLETEYLEPILKSLQKNNGYPYADHRKKLQLLIDIKTNSIHTLETLIRLLKKYPALIQCKSLGWVITGSRPHESLFSSYPDFILFDGELHKNYSKDALTKITLMSDDFKRYSLWKGADIPSATDDSTLHSAVKKAHDLHKPVRFWNAPDQPNAWKELMRLQVDYIN